jgi:hypothetical protein
MGGGVQAKLLLVISSETSQISPNPGCRLQKLTSRITRCSIFAGLDGKFSFS